MEESMSPQEFANAPEVREAQELVARTEAAITGFKISTPVEYENSATVLKKIKAGQKRLEELRTAITGPLNAALKAVNDLFRAPADKLAAAERSIKAEINRYAEEQERIRREEQRKADEAARKEQEKLQAQAQRAAEKGKVEKAAELEQRAATVVAPVIHREPPKVTGISAREVWKAEVTDLAALVKAIAEGKAPLALVQANTTVVGQQARSLKQDFQVPGVKVWAERQIAAGAA
jgi:colicin import membrane protein